MAYRQYTQCVNRTNYIGAVAAQVLIAAAVSAIPLLVSGSVVPGVGLVIFGALIAYCRWWLYGRLICLGGDVCALGWVVTIEPPSEKSGLDVFDTDYSFSIALAPDVLGATRAEAESGPQGHLIQPQLASAGLDFSGNDVRQYSNYEPTATLHCEFEGAGVYDLLIACLIAYALCVAAMIAAFIPGIGWLLALIFSLIAAAVGGVGAVVAANDQGSPSDADPSVGEIHQNDPTGRGADVVVVRGTWVYDSAHSGWNEIHPIKHFQIVGTWGGGWQLDAALASKAWCEAIDRAQSAMTIANQKQPENQWVIHPSIDGCGAYDMQAPARQLR